MRWRAEMGSVIATITLKSAVGRCADRHPAGGRAHCRRDRATAVYGAVQPVLDVQPEPADGKSAGHDLPVRDEPLTRTGRSWPGRGVFLITMGVLALNILARVLFRNKH